MGDKDKPADLAESGIFKKIDDLNLQHSNELKEVVTRLRALSPRELRALHIETLTSRVEALRRVREEHLAERNRIINEDYDLIISETETELAEADKFTPREHLARLVDMQIDMYSGVSAFTEGGVVAKDKIFDKDKHLDDYLRGTGLLILGLENDKSDGMPPDTKANPQLKALYWAIGRRINTTIDIQARVAEVKQQTRDLQREFEVYEISAQQTISEKDRAVTDLQAKLAEAEKKAVDAVNRYEMAGRNYAEKEAGLRAEVEPLKEAQRKAAFAAVQNEAYKRLTEERIAEIKAEKDGVELKNRELNRKLTSALDANITLEEQVTALQDAQDALETAKKAAEDSLKEFRTLYNECEAQFAALRDKHGESTAAFDLERIQTAKQLEEAKDAIELADKSRRRWQLGTLATAVVALGIAVGAAIAVKSKTPLTIERIVEKPVIQYVEKPVEKPVQSNTIYWPVAFGVGYDVDKDAAQLLKETIGRMEAEEGRTYSENEISVALSRIAGNDKVITLSEVERANDQLGYTVSVDGKRFYIGKGQREKLNSVIGRMEKEQGRTYNVEELSRIVKSTDKDNNRTITNEEVEILKRLLGY